MAEDPTNTQALIAHAKDIAIKHGIKLIENKNLRGLELKAKYEECVYVITIGREWIGYELVVSRIVLGKKIGIANDTDNYLLGGENTSISRGIYAEALHYLSALAGGRIYRGLIGKRPTLAVPLTDKDYKLISYGLFSTKKSYISKEELVKLSGMRPLS